MFNDFFNNVHSLVSNDTVNVNEYSYFFLMLIEQYMQPAVEKLPNIAEFDHCVKERGR